MASVTKDTVLAALRQVVFPGSGQDIVSMGWVSDVLVADGQVTFAIEVPAGLGPQLEPLRRQASDVAAALPGVMGATVVLTAQREAPAPATAGKLELPGVRHVVAVASGKGGVGKSTTSANLALAFARLGLKVALFDADIYGPSTPRMLGVSAVQLPGEGDRLRPVENHGLKLMSIGFMVPEDAPVIWRGPMVMGALEQLLRDTEWGEIDIMVVDMPPGTGDTQLTICQKVSLAGAVIVSTPQDIALLDARKGLNMFRKVEVPVLGIIENMSYYVCPACGHREDVFSHGGAHRTADELECDFLGEIPLDIRIRQTADEGTPIVVADPEGAHATAYVDIARKIWDKIDQPARKRPRFRIF